MEVAASRSSRWRQVRAAPDLQHQAPSLPSVLGSLATPAVVVPAFLESGYHVRVDLPAQAGPGVTITRW